MIWVAYNGYCGDASVAALVEADSEDEAREKAVAAFLTEEESGKPGYCEIKEIHVVELPRVIEVYGL